MHELTHIGLDVHKDTIAVAVLRSGTTTCDERVIPNTPEAVRKLLSRHADPSLLRTCYEAGPTGYDTHRLVTSLGIACDVIAPSLIPNVRRFSGASRRGAVYRSPWPRPLKALVRRTAPPLSHVAASTPGHATARCLYTEKSQESQL